MERQFGTSQVFLWTFGATLGQVACFAALRAIEPGSATDLVSLGAVEGLVFGLAAFLVWHLYGRARSVGDFLGVRRTHPLLPIVGLALGVSLQAPADTLQFVVEWSLGPPDEAEVLARAAMLRAETPYAAAMMMLSAAFLIPLVEEVLFRGAFFAALRAEVTRTGAAVLTGVCFVICHVEPRVWLPLAAVATVLSVLRVVSGSMLPGFALHLGFNAVSLAVVVLGVIPVDRRLNLPWQMSLAGWLLSAGLIQAMLKLGTTADAEQARTEDDVR
ncbi:MAG TPA: type II CAAX endopeptidase family protein [Polyangiaceae bacterium]